MATDGSQPKIKAIIIIAVVSIATLVVMRGTLFSYFNQQMGGELREKVLEAPTLQLDKLRLQVAKNFADAPVPLAKAIEIYVARGRGGLGETVEPKQSDDNAPLIGWTQRPQSVAPAANPAEAAKP